MGTELNHKITDAVEDLVQAITEDELINYSTGEAADKETLVSSMEDDSRYINCWSDVLQQKCYVSKDFLLIGSLH